MPKTTTIRTSETHGAETPHVPGAALIARAKKGDRTALDELLAEARPRALAVAMRVLKNRDEAEDAVQDAFIKVLRHITRFEERAAFSTWLHRIVVNTSLDRLRRTDPSQPAASSASEDDGAQPAQEIVDHETPEHHVERIEARTAIETAMGGLTPVHREVIKLREIEEYSYEEMARASRCPVGTIMSRLHHARRRLAEELTAAWDEALPRAA